MADSMLPETEWTEYVRKRFEPPAGVEMSYAEENDFFWLLDAPEQYEVEDLMLAYVKEHPDATMHELVEYFNEAVPDGLPPCADQWEDDDDE